MDLARARARQSKQAVTDADARLEEIATLQAETEGKRSEAIQKEQGVQVQLDRYIVRRDKSAKLLEGGSALDFLTVQRQLEQCTEKVEDLEMQVLEIMERRDELKKQLSALATDTETAQADRETAHATWLHDGRILAKELGELEPARAAAWADLAGEHRSQYGDMRRRNKAVTAEIISDSCSECHVSIQSQVGLEVRQGRRLHTCRGCGRWLVLPPEVDEQPTDA